MLSRTTLFVHVLIFCAFVGFCLASPALVWFLPWQSAWPWLAGTAVFAIAVVGSWRIWGECPFTIWENAWRKREGRTTYRGACTEHYAPMFGIHLRPGQSTLLLELVACIPIAVLLIKLLI